MSSDFENPAVRRDLAGLDWDAVCGVHEDVTEEISEEMATETTTAMDDDA